MDLNGVARIERPRSRREIARFEPGDAWLGGGTWLFSEPQPRLRRLIDLSLLEWPPLTVTERGLDIAATCTIAEMEAFAAPPAWRAASLFAPCCDAFLASFKIRNVATVGGNLCLALPAGPMIALAAALEGSCVVWDQSGGERHVAASDFVTGPQRTALAPGELLHRIELPDRALMRRASLRRVSLTPNGRSAALLIGTISAAGDLALTVTAATRRPVLIRFAGIPSLGELRDGLAEAIPVGGYWDDVHGRPDWRRHMTHLLAQEIRAELAAGRP